MSSRNEDVFTNFISSPTEGGGMNFTRDGEKLINPFISLGGLG